MMGSTLGGEKNAYFDLLFVDVEWKRGNHDFDVVLREDKWCGESGACDTVAVGSGNGARVPSTGLSRRARA